MSSVNFRKSSIDEAEKILEIKRKIQDEKYLDGAVYRLAMILSKKIIEGDDFLERK